MRKRRSEEEKEEGEEENEREGENERDKIGNSGGGILGFWVFKLRAWFQAFSTQSSATTGTRTSTTKYLNLNRRILINLDYISR